MSNQYHRERDLRTLQKTKRITATLPSFCAGFFRSLENTATPLTQYAYALDLRTFFHFLLQLRYPDHDNQKHAMFDLTLDDLRRLDVDDLEEFLSYVSHYEQDAQHSYQNDNRAKLRKLSAVRALFNYLFKKKLLDTNIAALVDAPKIKEKPIIRLEPNEAASLLDVVESGEQMTAHGQSYHKQTQKRDLAIITLLLGTGIRVSELVGLNISDIQFESSSFRVTRKGGSSVLLYFGDEVDAALRDYLEERNKVTAFDGHESALFLSMQKKRISTRAVQNLVKKYSQMAVPLKNISPHKLRSTYGTTLYQETGDIYLVADVLGHRDINTTKKHYAAQSDTNRRRAARVVRLRYDETPPAPADIDDSESNTDE